MTSNRRISTARRRAATVGALTALAALGALAAATAARADGDRELAQQLTNPLAALISVPMQLNLDDEVGAAGGERSTLNVQPVVPFALGPDWNVISRTIVPVIETSAPGGDEVSGVGDVVQSFFFSPSRATAGGWILGVGPVVLVPTGTEPELTTDGWGAGPTAVALRQRGAWTAGGLANHLWSVAGDERSSDVSSTLLQPFVSYVTRTRTTFALNTESTYDWEREQWSVPVHFTVSQLLKIGRQPLSVSAGARYWAESPQRGAEGWGLRFGLTLLFRK